VALMSTVGWWEDVAVHGAFLYEVHEEFRKAANANEPDYEMRHDSSPIKGKTFEEIFVNRLTRNYLKFQAHFNTIRPKAMKFLHEHDVARFQQVSTKLNDLLLKGQTCKICVVSFRLPSC
jgi:CCR4-NOT transcription complex subunit 2